MAAFSHPGKPHLENHKTIFVLDHTPYFGISCEDPIEFDFLKYPGFPPMSPIFKTLWTCSVESAIEYCRIVWDLFPREQLVRFIASDTVAYILNTWSPSQQNITHILNGMAFIGIPPSPPPLPSVDAPSDHTVLHGLKAAIEALSEPTEFQTEKMKSLPEGQPISNRCRVICITAIRDNDSMKRLEDIFLTVLNQQNQVASASSMPLLVDHCHLVILNTFPLNVDSPVNNHPRMTLSPVLSTEVHTIEACNIPNKLLSLILDHYDLASTTVTDIPMKEGQNASSSTNYDVEIFHSSAAHTAILEGPNESAKSDLVAITTVKDGLEYETTNLKWRTPQGMTDPELHNHHEMHRITPVDVNSRPSRGLTNFILNGRSVMLDMPRRDGGTITSHLLTAHGGEIFIYTLCTASSILEDPPSISEGSSGKVTDYHMTNFCSFIKQNMLMPIKVKPLNDAIPPLIQMKQRLCRQTEYWPKTISSTTIFNLKNYVDPLPMLITKEELTDEEVFQCKQVIYNLVALESKMEPLPLLNTGQTREEQYKAMWNELELLVKNNLHSDNHRLLHSCLFNCRGSEPDVDFQKIAVATATTDLLISPGPLASNAGPSSKTVGSSGSTKRILSTLPLSDSMKKPKPVQSSLGDRAEA